MTHRPQLTAGEPGAGLPSGKPGRFDPERLAFFSDAVMAIAITLLVIDLRIPELGPDPTEAALQAELRALIPQLFAFAVSFAVIAVWWNAHRRLFGLLVEGDAWILVLNFVFLAGVAFLPFPTSIIGRYDDLASAVILYALTNIVIAVASFAMWWHAGRAGLLVASLDERAIHRRLGVITVAPIVFGLSIPIAVVNPTAATWSWNLIWITLLVWRVIGRRTATAADPPAVDEDG